MVDADTKRDGRTNYYVGGKETSLIRYKDVRIFLCFLLFRVVELLFNPPLPKKFPPAGSGNKNTFHLLSSSRLQSCKNNLKISVSLLPALLLSIWIPGRINQKSFCWRKELIFKITRRIFEVINEVKFISFIIFFLIRTSF